MTDSRNDGKVGYRRPPPHTRFKPGVSGNSKGRPKGTANLRTDLKLELSERIRVREGDRDLKISKQRAMLKALVAKALKGDTRAGNVIFGMVQRLFEQEAPEEIVPDLTRDDQAILERFLERQIGKAPADKPRGSSVVRGGAPENTDE